MLWCMSLFFAFSMCSLLSWEFYLQYLLQSPEIYLIFNELSTAAVIYEIAREGKKLCSNFWCSFCYLLVLIVTIEMFYNCLEVCVKVVVVGLTLNT